MYNQRLLRNESKTAIENATRAKKRNRSNANATDEKVAAKAKVDEAVMRKRQ